MWGMMNSDMYEFYCQGLGEIYDALHDSGLRKLKHFLLGEVGFLSR
jgi:hypothetical protein